MRRLLSGLTLAFVLAGCSGGSGAGTPVKDATGPGDLSKLSPQEQIEKVRNDPQMPANLKETAINSIKQKNGIQ